MGFDYENARRDVWEAGGDPDDVNEYNEAKRNKNLKAMGINPEDYMDSAEKRRYRAQNEQQPQKSDEGCYVATCVYGSYDCPEVWTLRRYRDNTLGASVLGRALIRTYYAISPTIVKWFGEKSSFQRFWRSRLDQMVEKLQNDGVDNTPYCDKNWRANGGGKLNGI